MRGIRTFGLCVVAVLAVFALSAASASALPAPYWASCVKLKKEGEPKKYHGKYSNKTCTQEEAKGEGKYELEESTGKGKGFKGGTAKQKKGAETALVVMHFKNPITVDGAKLECLSASDEGKPEKPNVMTLSFIYTGCKLLGAKCKTSGAAEGEIKVTGLKGVLGYVEEAPEVVVGVKIKSAAEEPENPAMGFPGVLSEFECGEPGYLRSKTSGQAIGVMSKDVGAFSKEFGLAEDGKVGCGTETCKHPEPEFECASFKPGQCGYGEHEFDEKTYLPLVNILGWASEDEKIESCEAKRENCEEAHPAHVLKSEACGNYVKSLLGKECIEGIYSGLDVSLTNKGENLMVKT
jgi:hypothetical protein